MSLLWIVLILEVPAVTVILWADSIAARDRALSSAERILACLVGFVPLVALALAGFALKVHLIYGVIHVVLSSVAVVTFSLHFGLARSSFKVLLATLFLPTLTLSFAVSFDLTTVVKCSRSADTGARSQIIDNLRVIQTSASEALKALAKNSSLATIETDSLQARLEQQRKIASELQLTRAKLLKVIEEHRRLASAAVKNARALTQAPERSGLIDHLIAFGTGLLVNMVFHVIAKRLPKTDGR